MYEIMSHRPPWADTQQKQVFNQVLAGKRPSLEAGDETIPEWVELMNECWAQQPQARLEFDAILSRLKIIHRDKANRSVYRSGRSTQRTDDPGAMQVELGAYYRLQEEPSF